MDPNVIPSANPYDIQLENTPVWRGLLPLLWGGSPMEYASDVSDLVPMMGGMVPGGISKFTSLYRGETTPYHKAWTDPLLQQLAGAWYTPDPDTAQKFARGVPGGLGRVLN